MPKKVEQFENERKEVLNKMFQILGINEQNNMFSLHKIDGDQEKQNAIINLQDDIKKYFLASRWTCFNKADNCKRIWLSMIKNVVKDMGYNITSSNIVSKSDDYMHNGTIYFITPKT